MADGMTTRTIARIERHGEAIASFYFEGLAPAAPGQFFTLWLPGLDEKPFSVSALLGPLTEITVCAVGPFTRALLCCQAGDRVGLRGPFGRGFPVQPGSLLVGGGMGIAPLRHLARSLTRLGLGPRLALGARTAAAVPFPGEFTEMGARFATEDGSLGHCGRVTELLEPLVEQEWPRLVCACGPEAMLVALKRFCEERGLDYRFSLERYMKCAIGICGQCCLDGSGLRVCREGPVVGPTELALVTELGTPHRDASGLRRRPEQA